MRKGKFLRLIFLVATSMFIMFVVLFSQNYLNLSGEHATEINEPIGDTLVTLNEYKVYDLVDVPFRFIIAEIKISNIRPIQFELSRFQSDEGLILSAIDDYRSEITQKGYDLSIQSIATQLMSNENELNAKILIPIKNYYRSTLVVHISGTKTDRLVFNLNDSELGTAEELGKTVAISKDSVDEEPVDSDIVEDPDDLDDGGGEENEEKFISNTIQFISGHLINKDLILYKGLEKYHRVDFASSVRILLVNITFDYDYDVQIVAARINFKESDDLAFALGPEYIVENGNNILGKVVQQESGSLIFQIDNRLYDLVNQEYTIEVRFSEKSNWVSIPFNE